MKYPKTGGYCWNSRRWLDFHPDPPQTCPYLGDQGSMYCQDERCGYYENRPVNQYYKSVFRTLSWTTQQILLGEDDETPDTL